MCRCFLTSCRGRLVARSLGDYFAGGSLRLGVTGLSRSGKTVFLTALVNNLLAGARLPVLAARRKDASPASGSSRSRTTPCRAFPMRITSRPDWPRSAMAAIDPAHFPTPVDDRLRERFRLVEGTQTYRSISSTIGRMAARPAAAR